MKDKHSSERVKLNTENETEHLNYLFNLEYQNCFDIPSRKSVSV